MGKEEMMHLKSLNFNQKGDNLLQDQFQTRILTRVCINYQLCLFS